MKLNPTLIMTLNKAMEEGGSSIDPTEEMLIITFLQQARQLGQTADMILEVIQDEPSEEIEKSIKKFPLRKAWSDAARAAAAEARRGMGGSSDGPEAGHGDDGGDTDFPVGGGGWSANDVAALQNHDDPVVANAAASALSGYKINAASASKLTSALKESGAPFASPKAPKVSAPALKVSTRVKNSLAASGGSKPSNFDMGTSKGWKPNDVAAMMNHPNAAVSGIAARALEGRPISDKQARILKGALKRDGAVEAK